METKTIGKYKVNMRSKANAENPNFNTLTVTLSENLRELIKSVCVEGETEFLVEEGSETITKKRYLVKGYIFSTLTSFRDTLFIQELVDTGKISFNFHSLDRRDNFKSYLRENLRILIRAIERDELDENLTFSVRREE